MRDLAHNALPTPTWIPNVAAYFEALGWWLHGRGRWPLTLHCGYDAMRATRTVGAIRTSRSCLVLLCCWLRERQAQRCTHYPSVPKMEG